MSAATIAAAAVCIAATVGLVVAEWRQWRAARWGLKVLASSAFVAFAVAAGATGSQYGRLVLAALVLSWVGDLLLLPPRGPTFLAGLLAFLIAHLIYAFAFALQTIDLTALLFGWLLMIGVAAVVLRWLWTHLSELYRRAVVVYLAAIAMMVALAVAASVATGSPRFAAGALAFAASDAFVARHRFVAPGPLNRTWGLPLYYAAQLLLASTVAPLGR